MNNIFRKEALESMSDTHETDTLIKVVTTPGWLALLGFAILFFIIIVWSIFGSISTHIAGKGIILKKGGVFNIVSNGTGQVIKVNVKANDYVKEGDIIAVINQPALKEKISITEKQLQQLNDEFETEKSASQKRFAVRTEYLQKQKEIALNNIDNFKSRLDFLNEQLSSQKELLDKGLITNEQYENIRQQVSETQVKIQETNNNLVQTEYDLLELENQKFDLLSKNEDRIEETERELQILKSQYEIETKVVSSFEGVILEVKVYEGSNISTSTAVASIESNQTEIQAVIYLSPYEGKKVKEKMSVQIVPSTVTKEEAGFMIGEVTDISKFPMTTSAITATIDNDGLVSLFTKDGPPIAVIVKFKIDANTKKYLWSSSRSIDIEVTPGTLCSSQIMVKEQRPISMVMPYLKKLL